LICFAIYQAIFTRWSYNNVFCHLYTTAITLPYIPLLPLLLLLLLLMTTKTIFHFKQNYFNGVANVSIKN